jgi:dihydrofolate reductase
MMTTLDGRLDDPAAFVSGVDDKQYEVIDRRFEAFDTILIGTNTYAEMHAYWPGALTDETGFVNANALKNVVAPDDDALAGFVADLKAQPGENIHLAGGAALAADFVRLGLVDEYRFMVYPVLSRGVRWFDKAKDTSDIELVSSASFANGVVELHYVAPLASRPRPPF